MDQCSSSGLNPCDWSDSEQTLRLQQWTASTWAAKSDYSALFHLAGEEAVVDKQTGKKTQFKNSEVSLAINFT